MSSKPLLPSFLRSTLSLAFIICVIASITMVFMGIEPNEVTFGIITAVVSAYLTNYGTRNEAKEKTDDKPFTSTKIKPAQEQSTDDYELSFISKKFTGE